MAIQWLLLWSLGRLGALQACLEMPVGAWALLPWLKPAPLPPYPAAPRLQLSPLGTPPVSRAARLGERDAVVRGQPHVAECRFALPMHVYNLQGTYWVRII